MPHLVILYTPNLDRETDMTALCRALANTLLAVRDEVGAPIFPTGGVRVFAYPAAHCAVADGGAAGRVAGSTGDYAFAYLNLRMGRGRSEAVRKQTGDALAATAGAHFAPLMAQRHLGFTLQIDEGPEVFDFKHSTIHPLFK